MRARGARVAGPLVVIATVAAALGPQWPRPSSRVASPALASPVLASDRAPRVLGLADGAMPEQATVFASDVPGVANLNVALLDALRRAATDASRDGVTFSVDSGWRSAAYQARLLQEAVAKYGSSQEAARWVATPERSAHVSGNAVDLGGSGARSWLAAHGALYGLCRIYDNEPWHFELRPAAVAHGCPARYVDAAHDPSLQP